MKFLLIFPVLIILAIGLIGVYLTPNDLATCSAQPSTDVKCQKADAVVAVSGGNTPLRAAEAIRLHQDGWGKYLIFAGAAKDESGPSNAAVMRTQAIEAGVPAEVIIVEETSRTTHENAQNLDESLRQNDINSIIVVTSPYHQRRASLEFEQRYANEITVRNHPAPDESDWPWYWWATPRGWWLAVGELVKIGATHAGESS